jgi:hypothetical protein
MASLILILTSLFRHPNMSATVQYDSGVRAWRLNARLKERGIYTSIRIEGISEEQNSKDCESSVVDGGVRVIVAGIPRVFTARHGAQDASRLEVRQPTSVPDWEGEGVAVVGARGCEEFVAVKSWCNEESKFHRTNTMQHAVRGRFHAWVGSCFRHLSQFHQKCSSISHACSMFYQYIFSAARPSQLALHHMSERQPLFKNASEASLKTPI